MKIAAVTRVWIVLLVVVSLQAQESPLQWEFSTESSGIKTRARRAETAGIRDRSISTRPAGPSTRGR